MRILNSDAVLSVRIFRALDVKVWNELCDAFFDRSSPPDDFLIHSGLASLYFLDLGFFSLSQGGGFVDPWDMARWGLSRGQYVIFVPKENRERFLGPAFQFVDFEPILINSKREVLADGL